MGWSAGTFTRTDGTRTGTEVWQEAEGAGVNIVSSDHDVHDQDLADGINACIKKDGGNSPTANIPFNSKKITGFAQGSDRTDSIRLDQVQDGDLIYAGTVGGTADAIELTMSPASGGPVEGMTVWFVAGSDNTGATTVDLDSNGAVAVQWLGAALVGGEIKSGQTHSITYDGTQWQLNNPSLLGRLASTSNGLGASLVGIEDSAGNFSATDVEAALAEILSNLASNSTDLGASLVGIEDSGGNFTATTVEAAFAELASTANGEGASIIGVEDSGGIITATDVEGALAEIQTDLDAVEADYLTSSDILDEDDFSTDSATKAPSQQSTKAYVDGEVSFGTKLLHVQDQKTSGTNSASLTEDTWNTRELNTALTNEITGSSLSSNQITLPAGTYYIEASATGVIANGQHHIRLRNTSDSATELVGSSEIGRTSENTDNASRSFLAGRFTLAASKTLELQHYINDQWSTHAGVNSGEVEVYADARVWKVG